MRVLVVSLTTFDTIEYTDCSSIWYDDTSKILKVVKNDVGYEYDATKYRVVII